MKKIRMSGTNRFALVDDDMYEELNKVSWSLHNNGYARNTGLGYMHRIVNKTPEGVQTDHIDGDKLDNRRENLRDCTNSQNQMNVNRTKNTKTGVRGVTLNKSSKKNPYTARIRMNGVHTHLGMIPTVEAAAEAYNQAAEKHHKEFAVLNHV